MKKELKNYAFIDSQNLNLEIQRLGWKLDFRKFRIYLKEKYTIKKAFLFIGYIHGNQALYNSLQEWGYILIFKPVLQIRNKIKGNVDAELVLHTMIQYQNYEKALIVTGDGDFYCLAKYLNENSKLFKLLIPNMHRYSAVLRVFAPKKIGFMNNLRKKLEYKKERH